MEKAIEWVKNHKPHTAAIAIVVVAVIAVSIAAASGAFTQQDKTDTDEQKTVDVTLSVTADHGWDENSTPAIAHIEGNDVDFYHAVTPDADGNKGTSTVELAEGDYTVSFVSPVNSDGSAFDIYDTGAPVDITVDADAKTAPAVNCPMAQIPADKVTDDMLADIVNKTKDAIKKGDETLKGDAGTGILDKLDGNVAKNPNASDKTKQEATDADKDVDVNDKPAQTTPSAKNDGNKADSNAGSQSSNANSSNFGSGNAGNSGSSSSQPSKPAHSHSWKDHIATKQVWIPNIVTVTDYTDQQVPVGTRYIFAEDGFATTDSSVATAHAVELIKQGYFGNYRMETVYETQRVPAGSHEEDHGRYETQTYVDYQYCDCGATR
ncbi:MAG: hypothetical protein ACLTMI_02595 [Collinsella sp.]